MSARQIRLTTPEQIQKRLRAFTGKKINIVLRNRTVLFGELAELDQTTLRFFNMRHKPVSLLLQDISEVYTDIDE